MSTTKSYFDKHSHHHPYVKDPTFYQSIIDNIAMIKTKDQVSVLDLGCGNGSFIKGLITTGIDGIFIGTDFSHSMIQQAKDNLSEYEKVHLFVADGFNLPIDSKNMRFDLIHLDSVLHHLIGDTRADSTSLAQRMLELLAKLLTENGVVLVEEMYYVSNVIPHFTSSMIFYGLKLINSLHIDISKLRYEFQPGLEVNFFSQGQIENLLEHFGNVKILRKHPWSKIPALYRLFLLKDAGHISFLAGQKHGDTSLK